MKKFDQSNLQYIFEKGRNLPQERLLIAIEKLPKNGMDVVLYDISDFSKDIESIEEFNSQCDTLGYDEESFEVDRATLVRMDFEK